MEGNRRETAIGNTLAEHLFARGEKEASRFGAASRAEITARAGRNEVHLQRAIASGHQMLPTPGLALSIAGSPEFSVATRLLIRESSAGMERLALGDAAPGGFS